MITKYRIVMSILPILFLAVVFSCWPEEEREHRVPFGRLIVPKGDLIGQTYTNRCIFVSGQRLKGVTNFAIRDCSLFDCRDVGIWVEKDLTNVSIEITGCLISMSDHK